MINLIPPEGKKTIIREYWIRVTSVWAFLLSGICISIGLLMIPVYVLINGHLNALQGEIHENTDAEEVFKEAEEEVGRTNAVVDELGLPLPNTSMSEIIRAVKEAAVVGIEVRRFEITRKDLLIEGFRIQGIAATRDSLADFKTALERLPLFESVALPISDLAHEVDLPFAVTITLSSAYK